MAANPLLIGSDIYRRSTYGGTHPLAIPRVSTAIDLCRALGWLGPDSYIDSPRATAGQLARFHDPDYIDAVQRAQRDGRLSDADRKRYNIGVNGNPIFPEIFDRPATSCGASIWAGERLSEPGLIYNPAGGTHHGRPASAHGFCYFNDPVLAILSMRDAGLDRIAYVDFDAHHGDGVQDAFAGTPWCLTVSIHEAGRWPRTGDVHDRAGGSARNLPVQPGFNDSELDFLVENSVVPLIARFSPVAIVIQGGADCLADDPLSGLALSNGALWRAIDHIARLTDRCLVLGGGGYNPWSVARAWCGVWGTLSGRPIPDHLPFSAETVLRALTWRRSQGRNPPERWFTSLADPPNPGPIRDETRWIAAEVLR